MKDRDQILSHIKSGTALDKDPIKKPLFRSTERDKRLIGWQEFEKKRANHNERLVEDFARECELVSGKVYVARTDDEARRFLSAILERSGIEKVMKWDVPLLKRLKIDRLLDALGVRNVLPAEKDFPDGVGQGDYIGSASCAELGISGADYGLADTGTLVLKALSGQERSTSLLPPMHVAVLEANKILPGLDELITQLMIDIEENRSLDSCLSLITGPSRTADIEINLVLGIHGPKDLHVIILKPA